MTHSWPTPFEEILRTHLPLLPPDEPLDPEASLEDLGLDSLATVGLLISIEDTFEVSFPDDLLNAETFATPGRLWQVMRDLQGSVASG